MRRQRRISDVLRSRKRFELVRQFNCHTNGCSEAASGDIAAQGKWAMERVLSQTDCYAATVPRNGPQVTRW
jgi:hypothetical protein